MAQNTLSKTEWKKFLHMSASFLSCCSLPELTPNQVLLPRQQSAMFLPNRERSIPFFVCVQERQSGNNCLFPKRSQPLLTSTKRQDPGVLCPARLQQDGRVLSLRPGAGVPLLSQPAARIYAIGWHCSIAKTRLLTFKFTPCELGHWQLNSWVLNSSCSEQWFRLFNLSGF